MHKLCVDVEESKRLMEAIHGEECGAHMNGVMLAQKILRKGYYWSTMDEDCIGFVRRCHKCQIHANHMNIPSSKLYNMTSPWPFSVWGIDVIAENFPIVACPLEVICFDEKGAAVFPDPWTFFFLYA